MLKAILSKDDHAKLTKELQAEYGEKDGKMILAVESVDGWGLEPVSELKSALSTERKNAKTYFEQLERFKDLDPEKAREAMSKLEKLGKGTKDEDLKAAIDAQVAQVTSKHEGEKKTWAEREKLLTGEVQRVLVDSELRRILAGGNAEKAVGSPDLLIPVLRPNIRVEEDGGRFVTRVVDEKGTPLITRKSGSQAAMDLEEYALTTRSHPTLARAWDGTGSSGSGSSSNGAANGAGRARFQITQSQANNPAAYQAVRAEAAKAGQIPEIIAG